HDRGDHAGRAEPAAAPAEQRGDHELAEHAGQQQAEAGHPTARPSGYGHGVRPVRSPVLGVVSARDARLLPSRATARTLVTVGGGARRLAIEVAVLAPNGKTPPATRATSSHRGGGAGARRDGAADVAGFRLEDQRDRPHDRLLERRPLHACLPALDGSHAPGLPASRTESGRGRPGTATETGSTVTAKRYWRRWMQLRAAMSLAPLLALAS